MIAQAAKYYSQFRDQPPSREATARHRRWRLHLREFAKNSRIFRHPHGPKPGSCNFFSLVDKLLRTPLAFDMRMPPLTKGIRSTP